jgi:hypothetical protein
MEESERDVHFDSDWARLLRDKPTIRHKVTFSVVEKKSDVSFLNMKFLTGDRNLYS